MSISSSPIASQHHHTSYIRPAPLQSGPSQPRPRTPSGLPLLQDGSQRTTTPQHPGCVLCTLVASLSPTDELDPTRSASPSPTTAFLNTTSSSTYPQPTSHGHQQTRFIVQGREIVYYDNDVTIYRAEGKERLCSDGRHLIVVLNRHLESVYDLGPADIPILSRTLEISRRILSGTGSSSTQGDAERGNKAGDLRVGFVGNLKKDPQSPHAHLHAHAFLGPFDTSLPGSTIWRRNVVFGSMNWWSIEDLRAEIRESTSNNRIKSGYADRERAPIDAVPDAGARAGLPNALDPDPYTDSPPPSATTLPRSRRTDKQPEQQPPLDNPTRSRTALLAPPGHERSLSDTSSRGSSLGEEEGYVAVDINEGVGARR